MKYKFSSIRINVSKFDVTFVTNGGSNSQKPRGYRYATEQRSYGYTNNLTSTRESIQTQIFRLRSRRSNY